MVSPLVVKACNASDINLKEEYHLSKFHIYVLVYCIGAFFFFFSGFVAALGLPVAEASGGCSLGVGRGLLIVWLLLLWSTGSRQ